MDPSDMEALRFLAKKRGIPQAEAARVAVHDWLKAIKTDPDLSPELTEIWAASEFLHQQRRVKILHMLAKGELEAETYARAFETEKGKRFYRFKNQEFARHYAEAERELAEIAKQGQEAIVRAGKSKKKKWSEIPV